MTFETGPSDAYATRDRDPYGSEDPFADPYEDPFDEPYEEDPYSADVAYEDEPYDDFEEADAFDEAYPGDPTRGTGSHLGPMSTKSIAAVNAVLAVAFVVLGAIVVVVAADAATVTGGVDDPLHEYQLPLVIGAGLIILGAVVGVVSRRLWAGEENARVATMWLAGFALVLFYLELHVGALLVNGETFQNSLAWLGGGFVIAALYAAPVLYLMSRPAVRAYTTAPPVEELPDVYGAEEPYPAEPLYDDAGYPEEPVYADEADYAGEPVYADQGEPRPLGGGTVLTGEPLQPEVIVGQPLVAGAAVPEGAVSKTTCTTCATPLAVTTAARPLIVECPECGTHGHLGRRPGEWPGYA